MSATLRDAFAAAWPVYYHAPPVRSPLLAALGDAHRAAPAVAAALAQPYSLMDRPGDAHSMLRLTAARVVGEQPALAFVFDADDANTRAQSTILREQCAQVMAVRWRSAFLPEAAGVQGYSLLAMGVVALDQNQSLLAAVANRCTGLDVHWTGGMLGATDAIDDSLRDLMAVFEERTRDLLVRTVERAVEAYADWLARFPLTSVMRVLVHQQTVDELHARNLLLNAPGTELFACHRTIATLMLRQTQQVAHAFCDSVIAQHAQISPPVRELLETTLLRLAERYVNFRYHECFLLNEAAAAFDSYLSCDLAVAYAGVQPCVRPMRKRLADVPCAYMTRQNAAAVAVSAARGSPNEAACHYADRVVRRLSALAQLVFARQPAASSVPLSAASSSSAVMRRSPIELAMELLFGAMWRWFFLTHVMPLFVAQVSEQHAQIVTSLEMFLDPQCSSRVVRRCGVSSLAATLSEYAAVAFVCDEQRVLLALPCGDTRYVPQELFRQVTEAEQQQQQQEQAAAAGAGAGAARKQPIDKTPSRFSKRSGKLCALVLKLLQAENAPAADGRSEGSTGQRLSRSLLGSNEWSRRYDTRMIAVPKFALAKTTHESLPLCPDDERVVASLFAPPPLDASVVCTHVRPSTAFRVAWPDEHSLPPIARHLLSMLATHVASSDDDDELDIAPAAHAGQKRTLDEQQHSPRKVAALDNDEDGDNDDDEDAAEHEPAPEQNDDEHSSDDALTQSPARKRSFSASKRRVPDDLVRPSQLLALLIYYYNHLQQTAPALALTPRAQWHLSVEAQRQFGLSGSRARTLRVHGDSVLLPFARRLNQLERCNAHSKLNARLVDPDEDLLTAAV